jgi:hypothetical protein
MYSLDFHHYVRSLFTFVIVVHVVYGKYIVSINRPIFHIFSKMQSPTHTYISTADIIFAIPEAVIVYYGEYFKTIIM